MFLNKITVNICEVKSCAFAIIARVMSEMSITAKELVQMEWCFKGK